MESSNEQAPAIHWGGLFLEMQQRKAGVGGARGVLGPLLAACDTTEEERGGTWGSGEWGVDGKVVNPEAAGLSQLHLPLDPHVFEGVGLAVSVVEKELLSLEYGPFGKDPYPVIPVHHHHFSVAVRIDRMVCKADFVPFASGVYNKVIV